MKETLREYLQKITASRKTVHEYFNDKAATTGDLKHACKILCGEDWEWNAQLDAGLNRKHESLNRLIYLENNIVRCDVGSIDTSTLDGSLHGTWGTPIQSDDQLFDGSDNAQTVMGTDPSQPMQSGYDYAKKNH